MGQHDDLRRKLEEAQEEARIEAVENDLRLQHNLKAETKDLLPYRNEAHLALIAATQDVLDYYTTPVVQR